MRRRGRSPRPYRRLSRRWMRVSLVLIYTGLGGYVLAVAMAFWKAHELLTIGTVLAATVLVLAAGAVDLAFLRCPGCGRSIAIGDWRAGKSYRCRRCGSLYLFDDDPPDAAETTTKEEP